MIYKNLLSSPPLSEGDLGGDHPSGMSGRTNGRIISLDLARGFTVLFMPSIHVVMLYSTPQVQQSLLGSILGFIAEGPGAQLFMLLMGVSFALSRNTQPKQVIKRAVTLCIGGYALNIVKFIIPLTAGSMPQDLLTELNLADTEQAIRFFLKLGDILHFAAIAQIALLIIHRLRHYYIWSFALAAIIIIISPQLWDLHTGIPSLDYILSLFGGHPPFVYFPVFPWLLYPMIGLTLGHLLKTTDNNIVFRSSLLAGVILIIISLGLPATIPNIQWPDFYRTRPADSLCHLGIVLAWLGLFHWLSRKLKYKPFFKLLTFCSRHITIIYIIQWGLISWCLGIAGYLTQDLGSTFVWMTSITIATLSITLLINKFNGPRKSI